MQNIDKLTLIRKFRSLIKNQPSETHCLYDKYFFTVVNEIFTLSIKPEKGNVHITRFSSLVFRFDFLNLYVVYIECFIKGESKNILLTITNTKFDTLPSDMFYHGIDLSTTITTIRKIINKHARSKSITK